MRELVPQGTEQLRASNILFFSPVGILDEAVAVEVNRPLGSSTVLADFVHIRPSVVDMTEFDRQYRSPAA